MGQPVEGLEKQDSFGLSKVSISGHRGYLRACERVLVLFAAIKNTLALISPLRCAFNSF